MAAILSCLTARFPTTSSKNFYYYSHSGGGKYPELHRFGKVGNIHIMDSMCWEEEFGRRTLVNSNSESLLDTQSALVQSK